MKHIVIYLKSEWDLPLAFTESERLKLAEKSLDLLPHECAVTSELTTMPPYGATLAGTILKKLVPEGDFLGIYDEYMLKIPIEEIIKDLYKTYNENFTFFFSVYVFNNDCTVRLIEKLKQTYSNCFIVVGGAFSEHFINNKFVDTVIIGDAETGLPSYFKSKEKVIVAEKANPNEVELDFTLLKNDIKYNQGVINSMRGCKFRVKESRSCIFCSMFESSLRMRKPEIVLKEMAKEAIVLGVEWFYDGADSFVVSKKWLKEFSETRRFLISNGYPILENLKVFAYVNPSDVKDEEIPKLLFECGIRRVFFGVESGDDSVLLEMNKPKATVNANMKAFKIFQNSNIEIRFGIILGIKEDDSTLQNTFNLISSLDNYVNLNIVSVVLSVVIVLPGSVIYQNLLSNKYNISEIELNQIKDIDKNLKNGFGITKYEIDILSRIFLVRNNNISFEKLLNWKKNMEELLINKNIGLWTFGGYRRKSFYIPIINVF